MHIAQASIHRGLRWSTSRAYLRPAIRRPNLQVLSRTHITRIVVADGTVVGIEVADGPGATRITARREVVLCAGAFGSPKLLMLSGLGPADELRRHGIPVVADVAQVGQNLQNHPGVDVQWAADHSDSLTSQLGVVGTGAAGGGVGSVAAGSGGDELLRGRRIPPHQRRGGVPRHAVRVPRAHPQAGQRQADSGPRLPVLDGPVPAAQPRTRELALGGSRGPAVHRVQPSRRPAGPHRPRRRDPADPRDRRSAGLDALQPGRAHPGTGRHERR